MGRVLTQASIPVQPGETPVTAALRRYASSIGAVVTSTTDGAHSKMSHHYSGRAVDLASPEGPGWDTSYLLMINEKIVQTLPLSLISELIYSGPSNICVKAGRVVDGFVTYGPQVMARHHNHVHLAVVDTFDFNGTQEVLPMADDPNMPNITGPVQLQVLFDAAGVCTGYFVFSEATGELHSFGPGARFHGRSEVTKLVET